MSRLVYKKFTGLEIRCLKCNKTIHNDFSSKGGCKHPIDKTVYRAIVIIPNSGTKRITKTLHARIYDDAVKELIDYRRDVLKGIIQIPEKGMVFRPQLIIDCMAMYIDYLSDIDVPDHMKKHNSDGYINSQRTMFNNFLKFLKEENISKEFFKVSDINDLLLGRYYSFLLKLSDSNYTFNHHVKLMRAFYRFLIESKGYNIKNSFLSIKLKPEKGKDCSITSDDFFALLDIISPINSVQQIGKTKRNMFHDWLIDAFKLKAYTGRRNEEIFQMKWNMIHFEGITPVYMKTPNIKINKLQNQINEAEKDFIYVPIIEELELFLIEKGLADKKNTDEFIVAPTVIQRKSMEMKSSKSFAFFFKKLNRDYLIEMNYLRSTYITVQEIYAFKQAEKIRQHSDFRVTDKHYVNQKVIAKYISKDRGENKFIVFQKEPFLPKTTQ